MQQLGTRHLSLALGALLALALLASACTTSAPPAKQPAAAPQPTAAPAAKPTPAPAPAPTAAPAAPTKAAAPTAAPAAGPPPKDFPGGTVEWVAAAEPGGSFDVATQALIKALRDEGLTGVNHVINYKPGGGSAVGWNYVKQQKGSPRVVTVVAPQILTNHILKKTDLQHGDLTTIGLHSQEYIALALRPGLPAKTGAEFLAELKKDPKKFSIGVATAAGNHNHLGIAVAATAAGIKASDLRTVIFSSGGEAKTALLGGHIDAMSTQPATLEEFLEAGKVTIVAVTAPQRLGPPFDKVPTWKEQGVDVNFGAWRGVMAPPGLSAADASNWERLLAAVMKTKAWAELASRNQWTTAYMTSAESKVFLGKEYDLLTNLLKEIGLAK